VIEKLGLRGHQIGNAQISEKHPNFIVNLGEAKATEVKALIDLVKFRAQTELGISLQEEVKFIP
jgi:UDP-N-acetylmuramate dehydrogenase